MSTVWSIAHTGPNHHRHARHAAGHVVQVRRLIDKLVHGRRNELAEADLHNWSLPKQSSANRRANHRRFRNRRLPYSLRTKLSVQPMSAVHRTAHLTNVLSDVEHPRIPPHLVRDGVHNGFGLRQPPLDAAHAYTSSRPSSRS